MYKNDPIIVSILCATYNHEDYISECLEGLVAQKTNFRYEIIVHEDASTDNTRKIVQEYEKKYSDLIKPIYQNENQYSQGVKYYRTYIYPQAQGRYYAMCEGDDYWIDPYKLQKQVDFLEMNQDYSLVYTDYVEYIQSTGAWRKPDEEIHEGDVFEYLLKGRIRCRTLSVCFRSEIINKTPQLPKDYFTGDWLIFLTASLHGKFKFLSDVTGVYRILQESACHFLTYKEYCAFICYTTRTKLFFWDKYSAPLTRQNLIEKKKNYFIFIRSALVTRSYPDMKYIRFLPFPIWTFGSVVNTILCLLCKNKPFFYILSSVVNHLCYPSWQKKYEKQIRV